MLPKPYRLLSSEMSRVMKNGKRFAAPQLLLFLYKTNQTVSRFAFVVSTKIDKRATARNRIKRVLRESVQHRLSTISRGWDVIVIAKKSIADNTQQESEAILLPLFKQAGLLL